MYWVLVFSRQKCTPSVASILGNCYKSVAPCDFPGIKIRFVGKRRECALNWAWNNCALAGSRGNMMRWWRRVDGHVEVGGVKVGKESPRLQDRKRAWLGATEKERTRGNNWIRKNRRSKWEEFYSFVLSGEEKNLFLILFQGERRHRIERQGIRGKERRNADLNRGARCGWDVDRFMFVLLTSPASWFGLLIATKTKTKSNNIENWSLFFFVHPKFNKLSINIYKFWDWCT